MAVGELVFDGSAYRNVLCLGHILDADGRKMSKHQGNVIEPMAPHGSPRCRRRPLVHARGWICLVVSPRER